MLSSRAGQQDYLRSIAVGISQPKTGGQAGQRFIGSTFAYKRRGFSKRANASQPPKEKIYEVELSKALSPHDKAHIEVGVNLEDGLSKLKLSGSGTEWTIKMHEGRNRQIRRTFAALGYEVTKLHRTQFDTFTLNDLGNGRFQLV
jgi:pseudouridine synthase